MITRSLLYHLLIGYALATLVFALVWGLCGWLAWRKERAWTRERLRRL